MAQIDASMPVQAGMPSEGIIYLHTDHLLTNRLATDATRKVIWRWEGEAFGNTPALGSVSVNLRFPGQYYDAETNLHYNHFRYYDPELGRYITSDPIGLRGGMNTYGYVEQNPIVSIDPYGLETCLLTTDGPLGIRDHVAIHTTQGDGKGGPALFDPAGSFGAANGGGSAGIVIGDAASIKKFKEFHKKQKVETTCKDTEKKEEEDIIAKAVELPAAGPFECAINASGALSGQPSFPNVQSGTFFPGTLRNQVLK